LEEGLMEAGDMHECILVGYSDCLGNASARPTMYTPIKGRFWICLPWNKQETMDQTAAVTDYLTAAVIGSHICLKSEM